MDQHYPFPVFILPYSYVSLMPKLDADTLYYHYNHYVEAVHRLNELVRENHLTGCSLFELTTEPIPAPRVTAARIKNLAGAVFNHQLYFEGLYRPVMRVPDNQLTRAITKKYDSMERFQELIGQAANGINGSGWVWLIEENGELHICTTRDNEVVSLRSVSPIFIIDLWEHAYFTMHQFDRNAYLQNWFQLVNWDLADRRYQEAGA